VHLITKIKVLKCELGVIDGVIAISRVSVLRSSVFGGLMFSTQFLDMSRTFLGFCKGNLTDSRRELHLSLAKGNPK
jgi:hypothetical protein